MHQELFLFLRVSLFILHRLFFLTQVCSGKPIFSPFVNILLIEIAVQITHSYIDFTWFVVFSHYKLDDRLEHSDLSPFWIASKQIFLWDTNDFCHESIPKNAEFTFIEKISKKIYFAFLKEILIIYWMTLIYIYIYIYIYITKILIMSVNNYNTAKMAHDKDPPKSEKFHLFIEWPSFTFIYIYIWGSLNLIHMC